MEKVSTLPESLCFDFYDPPGCIEEMHTAAPKSALAHLGEPHHYRSCRTELERPEENKAGSPRVDVFGILRVSEPHVWVEPC